DIGAAIAAVTATTAGAEDGGASTAAPPPPAVTVAITQPAAGATVHDLVPVTAVTTGAGVVSVTFTLDGAPVGPTLSAPPYTFSLNTRLVPNGPHTLSAFARDGASQILASASISVVVANPLPSVRIATPHGGATVRGNVRVEAVVSHVTGFASLQFQLDGQQLGGTLTRTPYGIPWNTRTSLDGPHTLLAIVTTTGGATIVSDPVTVVVANPPPTVQITRPTAGSTVKGEIEIRAAVTHRHAIASLQFRLDDQDFGPALTGPQWAVPWNTLTAVDGAHTVRAVIVTLAGVTITSDPVAFVVFNPLPTV